MTSMERSAAAMTTDLFKALGDPVRWSIIQQMAAVDELPCSTLEKTLTISKPTISYHTKILVQAGLVSVRKESRNFYYTLRREVLHGLVDEVWAIAPEPRGMRDGRMDRTSGTADRRRKRAARPHLEAIEGAGMASGGTDAILLTW
jgi:DNA-binding transcriptional ArsR family regulator